MKLLILGFDGLGWSFMEPHLDYMPFYKRVTEEGVYGAYESVYESTPESWTSIYTGMKPEKHGVDQAWRHLLEQKKHVSGYRYYWDFLGEKGKVGVFAMPLTYPPREVNGWMVAGFPVPALPNDRLVFTYPASLNGLLEDYLPSVNRYWVMTKRSIKGFDDYIETAILVQHNKMVNFERVFERHPVDYVSAGFMFMDHIHHNVDCDFEQRETLCEMVNTLTEFFLEYEPERVLVVADHGWAHGEDAVLFMWGKGIGNMEVPRGVHEWDVCPLILSLTGINTPSYMDGRGFNF